MRTSVAAIVPVLNRPQNVAPLVESWRVAKNETADTFLLFVVSDRDDREIQAIADAGMASVEVPWPIGTRGDYARKINFGLWSTTAEFVLCAADDLRFHDGWADAAIAVLEDTGTGFCATNDLANPLVKAGTAHDAPGRPAFLRGRVRDDRHAGPDLSRGILASVRRQRGDRDGDVSRLFLVRETRDRPASPPDIRPGRGARLDL